MWEFTSLADQAHDIKVIYAGNVWWHKGMTKHSVDAIFYVTPIPRVDNYLHNAGMEGGSNGPWTATATDAPILDGWRATNGVGSSATITRDTAIHAADSFASMKIVQTHVSGFLEVYQYLPTPAAWRGKQVTVSIQVRQSVGAVVSALVGDNVAETYGATSATTGAFVTLTATRTIDAAANSVWVGFRITASATVYVDNVIANLGAVAATYSPEYFSAGAITTDLIADNAVTNAKGGVPTKAIVMFRYLAEIPAGWTRETDFDGRYPLGVGTTSGTAQTFSGNNWYGSWVPNVNNGTLGISNTMGIVDTLTINDGIGISDTIAINDTIGVSDGIGISNTLGVTHTLSAAASGSGGGTVQSGGGSSANVNGHTHPLAGSISLTGGVSKTGTVSKSGTVSRSGGVSKTGSVTRSGGIALSGGTSLTGSVAASTSILPAMTVYFASKN